MSSSKLFTGRLVQQPSELVVARHAALAIAQDVDGGEVEPIAVVLHQVLQRTRIVVQPHRARIGDAERVEEIGRIEAREQIDTALGRRARQLELAELVAAVRRTNRVVVRHQRVHPVDGHELLGERERDAVVIGRRTRNAAQDVDVLNDGGTRPAGLGSRPCQFARRPVLMTSCGRIAVDHSTVWIFARSAEFTRRAC